ncbi:MAG TPA: hypothetical protein VFV17_00055 [Usitatibacteraceae bacterium]|nr:hypothetical protein [Usitatibacteraceae bacterium]
MSPAPTPEPANGGNLKPSLCLALGVTGHRLSRLADADPAAIRTQISEVFDCIGRAATGVLARNGEAFAAAAPQLRLVSPLADGADTIAAEQALQAGWRLDVCLPFPPNEYAKDFAEGEHRQRFHALLDAAHAVFALKGDRDEAEAAYEAVGKLLLEQVDVLIAVWDGNVGRGRGGTARVVAEAIARHIPVIHVGLKGRAPVLLWSGLADYELEQPNHDNVPRGAALEVLPAAVTALTAPPEDAIDQRMLNRFYNEKRRSRTPALPYPMLLAMAGVRKLRLSDLEPESAETCAARLAEQMRAIARSDGPADALDSRIVTRFGLADSAAAYFAQIFRSGFVANFGLAAIAVLLALSGPLWPAYKLPLIVLELGVILIIFANTRAGTRAGWHECWMDYRHLAEQLRALALTGALGNLSLRSGAAGYAGSLPGWVHWLARATARERGLPRGTVDAGRLSEVRKAALALIDDQLGYHRANAHNMHVLESRLHRAGGILFGGTIVACAVWLAAKLGGLPMNGAPVGLTEIVTALTAALPALGAALYGIGMQGDFAGIEQRSEATVARLEPLRRAIADDTLDYTRLTARLKRLADIMLADVSHWRTTYKARPLKLPG